MELFLEFLSRKDREDKRRLGIISKALKKVDFQVKESIEEKDPYIYVYSKEKDLKFEGIRIYPIGKNFAYRTQREKDTEPYGKAYELNLEDAFNDLMNEYTEEKKAGIALIKNLGKQIKNFFDESLKAQNEMEDTTEQKPMVLKTGGTDYSGMVLSKM